MHCTVAFVLAITLQSAFISKDVSDVFFAFNECKPPHLTFLVVACRKLKEFMDESKKCMCELKEIHR